MLSALILSRPDNRVSDRDQIYWRSVLPGPLVLGTTPFKNPAGMPDMDRTVSRRSEPSSLTYVDCALMGEQPNPWNVLPLQDAMSRHQ